MPWVGRNATLPPSGLSQQRREAQHPPVDRHMVHLDTPLAEEFLDVAVGQAEAQVPADRQHDHIRREADPAKADRGMGSGRTRRVLMTPVWLVGSAHSRCNSAPPPHLRSRASLPSFASWTCGPVDSGLAAEDSASGFRSPRIRLRRVGGSLIHRRQHMLVEVGGDRGAGSAGVHLPLEPTRPRYRGRTRRGPKGGPVHLVAR
jgi:hypothetical protein